MQQEPVIYHLPPPQLQQTKRRGSCYGYTSARRLHSLGLGSTSRSKVLGRARVHGSGIGLAISQVLPEASFTILIWLSHVYFLKKTVFFPRCLFSNFATIFSTPAPSWCRASRSETAMRQTIPIGYVPCEGGYTKKRTGKGVIKVVLFIFCFWRYGTEDYYLTGTINKRGYVGGLVSSARRVAL